MKIKYNAPTTITYAFFCTFVVAIDQFALHGFTRAFFTVPNALAFDLLNPVNYLRLFTHIAGHADWGHLMTNMAYVLLLGPMLEEAYGSLTMLLMMVVTGFVTGVLNACFFPHPLLGASGVVFMMILLASFTNHSKDDIPLTFILIVILYLGREIIDAFKGDDISQFAHLAGGFCGSLFGFFQPTKSGTARTKNTDKTASVSTKQKRPTKPKDGSNLQPNGVVLKPPTGNRARTPQIRTPRGSAHAD
jgi:membrane associated rhomboid family serine protease